MPPPAPRRIVAASLCSGIGAPEHAMPEWDWLWSAEIERFPSAVLAARMPHSENLGDLTAPDFLARAIAAGIPDVLVAGTPCQAFSVAGLRAGLADARGNLTLTALLLWQGLCDAARHAGRACPVYFWENVPGVLSDRTNAFGCLLAALVGADAALVPPRQCGGWSDAGLVDGPAGRVAWRLLDAQYFGLAQRRARVFLVGCAGNGPDPGEILFEREGVRRDHPPRRQARKDVAPTISARVSGGGGLGTDFDLDGGLIAGTLEADTGHSRGAGTAPGSLVPETATTLRGRTQGDVDSDCTDTLIPLAFGGNDTRGPIEVATALNACGTASGRQDFESETFVVANTLRVPSHGAAWCGDGCDNLVAHTLRADGFDGSEDGTGRGTPSVPCYAVALRGRDGGATAEMGDDKAFALRASSGGDVAPTLRAMGHDDSHANAGGQIAVAFHENQRGELTINETTGALNVGGGKPGQGYPAVLTGATGYDTYNQSDTGDLAHTLRIGSSGKNVAPAVIQSMAVRRLTPVECERLQGFSEGHTLIPWRNAESSDGPRYKALGNSMAVPCVRWIGLRIAERIHFNPPTPPPPTPTPPVTSTQTHPTHFPVETPAATPRAP